jgi:outer membrane protein TolC
MGVAGPGGKDKPPGERVRELQGERVKALEEQLKGQDERVAVGREPLVTWLDALRDLEEAELDLAEKPAAEVEVLERSVRRFREAEDKVTEM